VLPENCNTRQSGNVLKLALKLNKCSVRAAPSGTKAGSGSTAVARSSVGQRVKIGGNANLALLWVYKSLGPDAGG
jgi:hypothetical protein